MGPDLHYLSHLAELGATNLHPSGRAATAQLIDHLDLQPGQQVLEIGCGTGEALVRVSLACDVEVTGVDILPEMLRVARRRLQWTGLQGRARTVEVRAGASLPFPDTSFDRVFTESVLGFQGTVSAETLLADILRVLKSGGRYVANEAVWQPSVSDELVASIYRTCQADFGLCHASPQNWSAEAWCNTMRAAGFRVLSADHLAGPAQPSGGLRNYRGWLNSHRPLLSRLVTVSYRIKASLSPRLVRQRLTYRQRLRRHRADGKLIEARLFVLQKPEGAPVRIENRDQASALDPIPPVP